MQKFKRTCAAFECTHTSRGYEFTIVHDTRQLVITHRQLGLLFKFRVLDW